ncbi:MAG: HAMP domain-containing protein [Anaerolineales bacterium]|jgi:signal transduction histidine kinase|uniref:sensor histidine kinase n=2 Tax=Candidatus Villigracilis proximus TaxID=3140683 RepID=UPI00313660F2|nr:HAMP domain-containing protein [Anaerolineales bacterium]MBK8821382.1 HAMP domain-containing protein [Anaerolineales bacterium]MBK9209523.1 HAMP domain-containing protein [Anaerolineales bacterium]
MKIIRSHLGIKLFLSYFVVIVVGMAVIGIITKITTPRAFARHLLFMEQQLGTGQGHGQGQGLGAGGMMSDFYQNFQQSFNESLLISVAAASLVALLVSFIFSKNILGPVSVMTSASRRIAEGHYDERVELRGNDELNQLAGSFNQMAEQLEQVESMRRQLIGDVAHELRTPLTAIKGTAEALMDGVLPASTETYQQIHSEAGRLSRLVDDLQELSRVESRSTQLDIHPVDSASLIQTVTKRLKYQFDEKRVKLTLSLPRDPIHVLADEGRILQVLTNLIGNALQYTPEHGTVTISIERDKNEALISVADTGDGIPPEHLARIFDRFYRVDKSRSRARGGSGIGLTIAKHLVESHGGRIWARSAGKEKGSVFIFTLPLAK